MENLAERYTKKGNFFLIVIVLHLKFFRRFSKMGSEQSQPSASGFGKIAQNPGYGRSIDSGSLPGSSRGVDIKQRGRSGDRPRRTLSDESLSTVTSSDSRPVSPPMSVYSDSDLPYISYTDKPIGDSPSKGPRNRNQLANRLLRSSTLATDRTSSSAQGRFGRQQTTSGNHGPSNAHNIVIVRSGPIISARESDIAKLQVSV